MLTNEQIQKRERLATDLLTIASWLENSATKNEDIDLNCEEVIKEANELVKFLNQEPGRREKMGSIAKISDEIYGKLWNLASKKYTYGTISQTWSEHVISQGIGSDKYYKPEQINKIVSVAVELSDFLRGTSANYQEMIENSNLWKIWTDCQKKMQEQMKIEEIQIPPK